MKTGVLLLLNLLLIGFFLLLLRKKALLSYFRGGKVWLTWLAIAIITLMDELTSVFYAPAEAHRFIGLSAIVFIPFTAFFIHYMTTRLVEIAEILEHHGVFGGGVYSFSYLVLGPTVSFIAVASIMVTYVLTVCISAVSAVENATSFLALPHAFKMTMALFLIWAVAGLNIIGIRENARFTFAIFIFAVFVFLNLIASGILALDADGVLRLKEGVSLTTSKLFGGSLFGFYGILISSLASCILAYSGVESVLQTASLVRSWRDIGKAYLFLAFTVGLITPMVSILALSAPIDFAGHEGDLITHYATLVSGIPFGIAVIVLSSFALTMAINTAFVASGELMDRVADRYSFHWLTATNRRQSLYRIHLINAMFFSVIIFITEGQQMILADMYALGLIASFCINMLSLLIYRYLMGTKEVRQFNTSRFITLLIWIIFVSCFAFLALARLHGLAMWASVTGVVLLVGFWVARKRSPEIKEIEKADSEMSMVLYLAQYSSSEVDIYFRRTREEVVCEGGVGGEVYVTFHSPRKGIPPKCADNEFRFALSKQGLYHHIVSVLKLIEYEMPEHKVTVHFGWPLSSWMDRLSIGVMVYNLLRLPRRFPQFRFRIDYDANSATRTKGGEGRGTTKG